MRDKETRKSGEKRGRKERSIYKKQKHGNDSIERKQRRQKLHKKALR